jgi:hypothetical protein
MSRCSARTAERFWSLFAASKMAVSPSVLTYHPLDCPLPSASLSTVQICSSAVMSERPANSDKEDAFMKYQENRLPLLPFSLRYWHPDSDERKKDIDTLVGPSVDPVDATKPTKRRTLLTAMLRRDRQFAARSSLAVYWGDELTAVAVMRVEYEAEVKLAGEAGAANGAIAPGNANADERKPGKVVNKVGKLRGRALKLVLLSAVVDRLALSLPLARVLDGSKVDNPWNKVAHFKIRAVLDRLLYAAFHYMIQCGTECPLRVYTEHPGLFADRLDNVGHHTEGFRCPRYDIPYQTLSRYLLDIQWVSRRSTLTQYDFKIQCAAFETAPLFTTPVLRMDLDALTILSCAGMKGSARIALHKWFLPLVSQDKLQHPIGAPASAENVYAACVFYASTAIALQDIVYDVGKKSPGTSPPARSRRFADGGTVITHARVRTLDSSGLDARVYGAAVDEAIQHMLCAAWQLVHYQGKLFDKIDKIAAGPPAAQKVVPAGHLNLPAAAPPN